tara:strand:- start:265 stop:468 length:204 start_codon:yes stop_codon:yes gene_type:complete
MVGRADLEIIWLKKDLRKMDLELKRSKWRAYMKEYRKRDYVKKKYHEYYIRKLIEGCAKDNEIQHQR